MRRRRRRRAPAQLEAAGALHSTQQHFHSETNIPMPRTFENNVLSGKFPGFRNTGMYDERM
jgi:hypothetical protein